MTSQSVEEIKFETSDGWTLAGDLTRGAEPKIAVLISSGTGFPRRFYRRVAAHLAARGAVVLTYDYRGIGDSGCEDLAGSGIEYSDWGRYDTTAAVAALANAAPGLRLTHLCHSVGGHFLGLMPNHDAIDRHAFASVGTGYWGRHHLRNVPSELYFWWVVGTYSLARWGYIKPVGGWQGAALPPNLFRTWRKWCHRASYFKPDLETSLMPQHYDAVSAPIRSWVFDDDPIATPRTAEDLLSVYPNAPKAVVRRSPADFGLKRIGHQGAFRAGCEPLWDEWWDWLSGETRVP